MSENVCGWYYIDEVWNLYVDAADPVDDTHRVLKPVRVDYINVDEKPNGDGYKVKHFDRSGDLITTVTTDYDDLRDITLDREETDRPMHI